MPKGEHRCRQAQSQIDAGGSRSALAMSVIAFQDLRGQQASSIRTWRVPAGPRANPFLRRLIEPRQRSPLVAVLRSELWEESTFRSAQQQHHPAPYVPRRASRRISLPRTNHCHCHSVPKDFGNKEIVWTLNDTAKPEDLRHVEAGLHRRRHGDAARVLRHPPPGKSLPCSRSRARAANHRRWGSRSGWRLRPLTMPPESEDGGWSMPTYGRGRGLMALQAREVERRTRSPRRARRASGRGPRTNQRRLRPRRRFVRVSRGSRLMVRLRIPVRARVIAATDERLVTFDPRQFKVWEDHRRFAVGATWVNPPIPAGTDGSFRPPSVSRAPEFGVRPAMGSGTRTRT